MKESLDQRNSCDRQTLNSNRMASPRDAIRLVHVAPGASTFAWKNYCDSRLRQFSQGR
jgi:hypothetical protein